MTGLSRLSRVELEALYRSRINRSKADKAAAIHAELAARVWQNVNPYA